MSGMAAVVGVTGVSVGSDGGAVDVDVGVGVGVTVLVGEANGAVGLAGTSVGVGGTGVGGTSVGAAVAVAVAVAVIVGVADALTVGEAAADVAVSGGVNAGSLAPVHPASTMTTSSQQRKVSL